MDVYAASDGYVLQLSKPLSEYDSVHELAEVIGPHLDLQVENILLFLEDGREVKDRLLLELADRGGSGQASKPKSDVLYLFNRETFWTEPQEWADKYKEEVSYPAPLDPGAIHDVETAQEPFLIAQDHIHHLLSLFQAQYRALSLAYQNLEHHLQPLRDEWDSLSRTAALQLREQEQLLDSAPSDLLLLPKVAIHPTFWSKRDQAGNIVSRAKDEAKEKTLADYIHPRKMEEVMETCRISHEDVQSRFLHLAAQMDEIVQLSNVERERAEESAMAAQLEFDRALQRLQDSFQDIAEGAEADTLVEVAMSRDEIMRGDLTDLTALKNDYTLDVHIHLRQVAQLESRIAEVVKPLTTLENDFKTKGAFPHLSRLHELPFAYFALALEYRWRKEYGQRFATWCNRLAEAIAMMLFPEVERRRALNKDVLSFNPFTIYSLDETTTPFCEPSYHTAAEALDVMSLDKGMTNEIDDWIARLANDIDSSFPPGPSRDALYDVVKELTARYEDFKLQLFGPNSASLEVQWDLALAANIKQLRSEQESPEADGQADELERIHQVELEAYQQRQDELEEELARLRAELGDEALARQALSAELEERNRASEDRQRDQEDQGELITALHAEVAQEKDRATDLGVRLQEALLDVDGLRNAEQTLISQLQQLREERTKHFQAASETQAANDELRAQVAGLQAQLEASNRQLLDAQQERDTAIKNQSTETERVMRDRIAEADGDRAVLEHQNVNLSKQLEDMKLEVEDKLTNARNTAIRQADGLKAELSFSKAQLRDAQRREAVLSDELAMLKESADALSSDRLHQTEIAKDAVAVASKYYETCRPLLRVVNAVATSKRTGSDDVDKDNDRPPSSASVARSTSDMRESVLVRSLASAKTFDLDAFAETINRVVVRLKRYTKGYKHMRDTAKNKISFTDFQRGDVALFLPTRDPTRRNWAAFNVNAPHHFLKPDGNGNGREGSDGRDWIMARITTSEEVIAGDSPESNPFGITPGLRYQVHGTEPFDAAAIPKLPRRSTSMGMNSLLLQDASPVQPSRIRPFTPGTSAPSALIAPVGPPTETPSGLSTSLRETAPPSMSPTVVTQKPDSYFPPMTTPPFSTEPVTDIAAAATATVPPPAPGQVEQPTPTDPPKLSPVAESMANSKGSATIPAPVRTSHYRTSSRSTASPTMRDAAIFAPSSLGRPASVASSHSPHPHTIPIGPPGGKSAPAMAITTSDGSGSHSPGDRGPFLDRRPSVSSNPLGQKEEGGIGRSPLGATTAAGSGSATPGDPSAGKITPRTVSRGFSIGGLGKKRTVSNASSVGADKTQTAVDILKQYEEKK